EDFEQHHDLREDKGVDEGEALHREIESVLAQDDALVEHENTEQDPEIEEEHDEPPELVGRPGLERMTAPAGPGRRVVRILSHRIPLGLLRGLLRLLAFFARRCWRARGLEGLEPRLKE